MHYSQILREELEKRKRRNPRYSLRGFARQLNIDSGHLSRLLRGQARISPSVAKRILPSLSLTPEQNQKFVHSILEELKSQIQGPEINLSHQPEIEGPVS